jgi:hypothetical protein
MPALVKSTTLNTANQQLATLKAAAYSALRAANHCSEIRLRSKPSRQCVATASLVTICTDLSFKTVRPLLQVLS